MLNESQMKWSDYLKDLRNYMVYDLSESEEIRQKRADFIWWANIKYEDAVPQVKLFLLNSY